MIHNIWVPQDGNIEFDDEMLWFVGTSKLIPELEQLVMNPFLRLPDGEIKWVNWYGPTACRLAFETVAPAFKRRWRTVLPDRIRFAPPVRRKPTNMELRPDSVQ